MVRLRWILLPVLVACLYKVMSPDASIWADDDALFLGSAPSHQVRCKRNLHSYSSAIADGHGYSTILLDVDDSVGSPVFGYGLLDDRDMYNGLYAGTYGKKAESTNDEHLLSANNGVSQSDVVGVTEAGGVIPPNNEVSAKETSDVVDVTEGDVIPSNNEVSAKGTSDVVAVTEAGGPVSPNNEVSANETSDVVGVSEAGGPISPNNEVSAKETGDVVAVTETGGVIPPNNEVSVDNSTSPPGTSPTQQEKSETSGAGGEKVKCEDDSSTFSEDASCGITGASNLGASNSNPDVEQAASSGTGVSDTLGENQGNDRQNVETSEINGEKEVNTQATEGEIGDKIGGANIAGGESPNVASDGVNSTDENQQTGSVNDNTDGESTNREVNGESTVDGVTGEQTAQSVSDVTQATTSDGVGNIQATEVVPTVAGSTGDISAMKSAVDSGLENTASGNDIADKAGESNAQIDQLSNNPPEIETTNGTSEVNNEETKSGVNEEIADGVRRKDDGVPTVGETLSGTEGADNQGSEGTTAGESTVDSNTDPYKPESGNTEIGEFSGATQLSETSEGSNGDGAAEKPGSSAGSAVLEETQTSQGVATGSAPAANEEDVKCQTDDIAGTTATSGVPAGEQQAADSIGVGSLKQDVAEEQARESLGANAEKDKANVVQGEAEETNIAGTDQLPSENNGKETDPSEPAAAKVEGASDGSPALSVSEQTEIGRGEQEQGEGIKTVGLNEGEETDKVDDRARDAALPVNNETGEQQPTGVGPEQLVTSPNVDTTGVENSVDIPEQSVNNLAGDTTGVGPEQPVTRPAGDTTGVGPEQLVTSPNVDTTGVENSGDIPEQSVNNLAGDTTGVGPEQPVTRPAGDTTGVITEQPVTRPAGDTTGVITEQPVTRPVGDTTGVENSGVNPEQSVNNLAGDTIGVENSDVNPEQSANISAGDTTGVNPEQSVNNLASDTIGVENSGVNPEQSVNNSAGDTTGIITEQSTNNLASDTTGVNPEQSVNNLAGDTTGVENSGVNPEQSVNNSAGDTTGIITEQPITIPNGNTTGVTPEQSVNNLAGDITGVIAEQSTNNSAGDTTGVENSGVNPEQSANISAGDTICVNPEQSVNNSAGDTTCVNPEQSVNNSAGDTTGVNPEQSVNYSAGDTTSVITEQPVTSPNSDTTGVNPEQSVNNSAGDTTSVITEQPVTSPNSDTTGVIAEQSVNHLAGDTTGVITEQPVTSPNSDATGIIAEQPVNKAAGDTTGVENSGANPEQSINNSAGDTTGVIAEQSLNNSSGDTTGVIPEQSLNNSAGDTTGVNPEQPVNNSAGDTTGVIAEQSVNNLAEDATGELHSGSNKNGEINVGNPEETSINQVQTAVGETPSGVGNDGIVEVSDRVPGEQKDGETNVGNLAEGDQNQAPGSEIVSEVQTEGAAGINGEREKESVSNVNVGNPAESSQSQVPGDSGTANNLESEGTLDEGKKAGIADQAKEASGSNNEENAPTRVPLDLPVEDTAGEGSSGKPPETKVGETSNQVTGNVESAGGDQVTTLNNAEEKSVDGAQNSGPSEEGVGKADQKTADGEELSGVKQDKSLGGETEVLAQGEDLSGVKQDKSLGGETEVLAQGERNNELDEASQISESSRNPTERTNAETIDEKYKQSVSENVKEPLDETQTGKEINISSENNAEKVPGVNEEKTGKLMQGEEKEDSVAVPIAGNSVTGKQLTEAGKVDNIEKVHEDVEIVPLDGKSAATGGVSGKLVSAVDDRLPVELVVAINEYRRQEEANRRRNAAAQLTNNFNGGTMGPLSGAGGGVECGCAEDMSNNLVNSECGECCGEEDCCGCDEYHYDLAGLPPLCPLCQQEFYSALLGQHNPYAVMPLIDYSRGRMCTRHRNAKYKKSAQLSPYIRKVLRALSYNPNNVYQQEVYKPFAYEKKGRKSVDRRPLPYIIERYFSVYGKTKPIPHKSVKMLYYNQRTGNRPKVFKLDKLQNT